MLKNIKTWTPSLKNKKVRCISNASGSSLIIGETYYIKQQSNAGGGRIDLKVNVSRTPGGPAWGGWTYLDELEEYEITVEILEEDIKELKKDKKEIDKTIKNKEEIIDFLLTNKLKTADEELIKTFRIMKKLNLGTLEDAKEIVEILNS